MLSDRFKVEVCQGVVPELYLPVLTRFGILAILWPE